MNSTFDSLSVLLVENPDWESYVVTHGLPDEAFERDETPMTKSEVRAISLSKLKLTQGAIVYDIGSGSGSVSVECALQARYGRVYAIEMKDKAIALTRRNAKKFHLSNLEVIAGTAPDILEDLPAPTHAFIGGSTGNMRGIVDCLLKKNPSVRIVVNTVTLETLSELTEISKDFDFCDIAEVSVNKPRLLGRYHLMTAQNIHFKAGVPAHAPVNEMTVEINCAVGGNAFKQQGKALALIRFFKTEILSVPGIGAFIGTLDAVFFFGRRAFDQEIVRKLYPLPVVIRKAGGSRAVTARGFTKIVGIHMLHNLFFGQVSPVETPVKVHQEQFAFVGIHRCNLPFFIFPEDASGY